MSNNLVQYIIVRSDLKWSVGALIGNACHASVSAIMKYMSTDSETQQYVQNLDSMTKVVLKAENESQLLEVCDCLTTNDIKYVLWTEQPENIVTCLATTPRDRNLMKPLLKHLKLFK